MAFEDTGNSDDIPFDFGEEHPSGEFDDFDDWDSWMRGNVYSDADMEADANLPPIRDESEVYDFEKSKETPEAPKSDFEKAMEYMDSAGWDALEAAAKAQEEQRESPAPNNDTSDDHTDPAAELLGGLHFDQDINLAAYESAIREAGLVRNPSPILAGFQIVNGDKFAATLEALPDNVSRPMLSGVSHAVHNALSYFRAAHTANASDADFETYGTPREASEGFAGHGPGHSAEAGTEVLAYAARIATELERIGADNQLYEYAAPLWEAKIAETEGMLPHWALADAWGLYEAPTRSGGDYEWTRWSTEQWSRVDEFLADAAFRAPADSAFMNRLVTKLHANIDLLRQRDFLPGHLPLPPGMQEPAPYYPQLATPEAAAAYDERLAAIQAQLRSLSGDL